MISKSEVNSLVRQVKAGDDQAFERLYTILHRPLKKFVFQYVRDTEMTQDVVQATFVKVLQAEIKNYDNCYGWIFTVARNLSLSLIRKKRWERPNDYLQDEKSYTMIDTETVDLKIALSKLPADDKELLSLRFDSDFTLWLLSEMYFTSLTTVQRRLAKIMEKLRKAVS